MAANLILPFSQGAGANVLSQAAFDSDPQRVIGHQPGVARAALANKAGLQASAVAVGVAQFLANFQATDVTDQLTAAQYSDIIKSALNSAGLFTTQAPGDSSTRPATCAFVQAAVGAAISSGAVVMFPGTSPPSGYVKANGALLSRVTYANLWAYAQASGNIAASDAAWTSGQFSPGDGATTFRVPDLRGYHLRAWDDSRGIDSGRGLGTVQADAFQNHSHGVNDPTHAHSVFDPTHSHSTTLNLGANGTTGPGAQSLRDGSNPIGTANYGSSAAATGVSIYAAGTGITIQAAGAASETRVKNVAMLACIKY